jgi:hypothetical protein
MAGMRNDEMAVRRHVRCHGTDSAATLFRARPLSADNVHYVKLNRERGLTALPRAALEVLGAAAREENFHRRRLVRLS